MTQLTSSSLLADHTDTPSARTDTEATEFDRTTRLQPLDHGTFAAELSEAWSSLIGIHGGYMTALAVRAAERHVPDRQVRTVTTSFERPGRPGPATLTVDEVRRGRSLSTVHVRVRQEDRTLISTRVTMLTEQSGVEWNDTRPIPVPPPSACVPIVPLTPTPHFDHADALLDPSSVPFTGGQHALVRGHLRPREPRPIDASWLAMASDWFPPPAFVRIDPPVGGISIDLVTHVHRTLPHLDDDWLTAQFEIRTSSGGLATEHGRIALPDGTILAESIQTRWTVTG